ncbi:MAG: DUF1592 domain-containing protein [Myxococcales bacterium]|nr:MAG: DUF1592 domain-containing protein [Myxococcales bacterium]
MFLYRVELSTEAKGDRIWLNSHEVASRLSFALWNSMPSDALLDAADKGELATAAGVEGWAKKLLDDPRAEQVLASFHGQLLDVSSYGKGVKSTEVYPGFTEELRPMFAQEAGLFFANVMGAERGGLRELLTSPVTYVNDKLAPIYGLSGSFGPEMKRVELDPKRRSGVLTQSGFLAKNGGLVQPDPIHRGVSIQLHLLCRTLTAPNMIPPLPEPKEGQTNRERVHDHTKVCGSGCHTDHINPTGFAFENFDSIGAWRDQDNGKPVDAADVLMLDGQEVSFKGAPELMAALVNSPEAHACYARNWTEYALGRPVAKGELGWVKQLGSTSRQGASAADLLIDLASSDLVRARPTSSEETAP